MQDWSLALGKYLIFVTTIILMCYMGTGYTQQVRLDCYRCGSLVCSLIVLCNSEMILMSLAGGGVSLGREQCGAGGSP